MEIEDMTMEQAMETFNLPAAQQAWAAVSQIMGPSVNEAFINDYKSKLLLGAALSTIIIHKNKPSADDALVLLKNSCVTEKDKSIWWFCKGIYHEVFGEEAEMMSCYLKAVEYDPSCYTAYIRIAKNCYASADYLSAKRFYKKAIACLEAIKEMSDREQAILSVCYSELAGSLLMMHQTEEAEEALESSKTIDPNRAERLVIEALLYAVMGDKDKVKKCVSEVKKKVPMAHEYAKTTTKQILKKESPHFDIVKFDKGYISLFWDWFVENENLLFQKNSNEIEDEIVEKLGSYADFVERIPKIRAAFSDNKWHITLADGFTRTLECFYDELIKECPPELGEKWAFTSAHFCSPIDDFKYAFVVVDADTEKAIRDKAAEKDDSPAIEEIFKFQDTTDFIIALGQHIGAKCGYGDYMDILSKPERVFYITYLLEAEVNNGGFSQFLYNSSGNFANEIVDAYLEIGAVKTSDICKKAFSIYDGEVPEDRDDREDVFLDNEELADILDECDEAFYQYDEDLSELTYAYVMKNRESFK